MRTFLLFGDLLPWNGHGESRESGRVEINKTWWQTAQVWCHPVMSAAGNDCSLVSRFRSFFGHLRAT